MSVDLRISERHWEELKLHLATSFERRDAPETGALAVLGARQCSTGTEFIVAQLLLPGADDLKTASSGEVVFDSSFVRRAHLIMRKERLAGIATFHTHPAADSHVGFSVYDDQQEPLLFENLAELDPSTKLISVVAGKSSQCGRVIAGRRTTPLQRLIVVGDRLSYLPLDGRPKPPVPPASAIFDRAMRVTGAGALYMLSGMTVVVVGASGTGSLMCELLARAGCKRVMVIDHDLVKIINLNRILHATKKDAEASLAKVVVLRRAIAEMELGCEIEPVVGSILNADVLKKVLGADLIIGCVDRALPRHLLCETAYRYLIPYVDLGSEIGAEGNEIVSLDSRVSYVAPGRHCLTCTGVVTPRALRFESLAEGERFREAALGYSDDLVMSQPAVMDLNMRAAGNAMLLVRHLLQPMLREPYPVSVSENAVTYRTIAVSAAKSANAKCPTCMANRQFGFGDHGTQIGFDAATAERLNGQTKAPLEHAHSPRSGWLLKGPHWFRQAVSSARRLFQNGTR